MGTPPFSLFYHHFLCDRLCGYDIKFDAFHHGSILLTAAVVQSCGLRYYTHTIWMGEKAVWGVGSLAREGVGVVVPRGLL